MEQNLPEGCSAFNLPEPHRRRPGTSNAIERVNQELKRRTRAAPASHPRRTRAAPAPHPRRTRVASLFPNEASLLRLVIALLCGVFVVLCGKSQKLSSYEH